MEISLVQVVIERKIAGCEPKKFYLRDHRHRSADPFGPPPGGLYPPRPKTVSIPMGRALALSPAGLRAGHICAEGLTGSPFSQPDAYLMPDGHTPKGATL